MKENRTTYRVKEKIQEGQDVVTLKLVSDSGIPLYVAGQFVTVFFDDISNGEGKSYTISSAPYEETLNLTVKGIGQFSNRLCAMNIGDTFEASLPSGYFYSEEDNTALVMIAGGIGVTPFRSMVLDSLKKNKERKIILFYSYKTHDDAVFVNECNELQAIYPHFKVISYITQENSVRDNVKKGRITISDIIKEVNLIDNKEILLCGSISFVRDFWKGLKNAGISEDIIYTEAFF